MPRNRSSSFEILPGFENVSSFWDPKWKRNVVKILPGGFYISEEDIVISTILGSCISVCIFDSDAGFGGMNHFMLPGCSEQDNTDRPFRYGLFAMEQLVNELMKHGCKHERMQMKVTGGGEMISGMSQIGLQNINFIKDYIEKEGFTVEAIDVGGDQARRVVYFPSTGRMLVSKLNHRQDQLLIDEERKYRNTVDQITESTSVDWF